MLYEINGVTYSDKKSRKIGNIMGACNVIIVDGSYAMTITKDNKLRKLYGVEFKNPKSRDLYEVLKVVAVNVPAPTDNGSIPEVAGYQNNIILRRQSGEIVFVSMINIELIDCPQIDFS